ncbi:hypothetical protein C8R45DRAFT_379845, partial [Mycena sanguinolenta]
DVLVASERICERARAPSRDCGRDVLPRTKCCGSQGPSKRGGGVKFTQGQERAALGTRRVLEDDGRGRGRCRWCGAGVDMRADRGGSEGLEEAYAPRSRIEARHRLVGSVELPRPPPPSSARSSERVWLVRQAVAAGLHLKYPTLRLLTYDRVRCSVYGGEAGSPSPSSSRLVRSIIPPLLRLLLILPRHRAPRPRATSPRAYPRQITGTEWLKRSRKAGKRENAKGGERR